MDFINISSVQAALLSQDIQVRDVIDYFLGNIHKYKSLNAFISIYGDDVDTYVGKINHKIKNDPQQLGPLFGVVMSIKDNICYQGHPSFAGSKILSSYISPYSATVVERLISADAFIIGSTNCDEFGMGSESTNETFGPVCNGWNPSLIAGGSSGGAAVSVQMDMCMAALGSDTGGSIRQPAAMTGVIGFKPSYGAVSRHGLIAYASSFDQIGILGKSTASIAAIYEVINGPDAFDATCGIALNEAFSSSKVGYLPSTLQEDTAINRDIHKWINDQSSVSIVPFELEGLDTLVACYYILTTAEASSNLARFDGVRYGYRSPDAHNLQELYVKSRTEGFGQEVKKRIMLGAFVLSEGYFDAYYTRAQKVRRWITDQINKIFEEVDFIILPSTSHEPWEHGQCAADPMSVYLSDIYTVLANITGCPAISIPIKVQGQESQYAHIQVLTKRKNDLSIIDFVDNGTIIA